MNDVAKGLEPLNRPIKPSERNLINWLLEHGKPGSREFLQQVGSLIVVWECACGCPTVNFAEEGQPVVHEAEHIFSDYLATVNGENVGIILFERGGRLSSLEIYSQAGTDKPFSLPLIENIYSFEELAARQADHAKSADQKSSRGLLGKIFGHSNK